MEAHSSMRELWGRYFLATNVKNKFDLITNLDMTLDTDNVGDSYWTLRSLLFFQINNGWFLDLGPAYRGGFGGDDKYHEIRVIGSFHYIKNTENWNFRNRLRFEKRWVKEGESDVLDRNDSFRFRLRTLIQKKNLVNISERLYAYAGPEFFFEQNSNRDNKIDLGSIRWIFSIGGVLTETLSMEVDYWHRQFINQKRPNFGSILLRLDQVF